MTETTVCPCGQPTRDHATSCDTCPQRLTVALGNVPALETELDITIARLKGVNYAGASSTTGTKEKPLPINVAASDLKTELRAVLTSWVKLCHDDQVRHQSPRVGLPIGTIPAMSRWLLWRVDGLAFHDAGHDAVTEIAGLTDRIEKMIDRPADKWFAGTCNAEAAETECGADLYAKSGKGQVKCRNCSTVYDVSERRAWLLAAAEDQLADATALARSVSWLGAQPLNSARVRKWAERGRITARSHDRQGRPLYRVGDAIDLLAADTRKKGA